MESTITIEKKEQLPVQQKKKRDQGSSREAKKMLIEFFQTE